MLRIALIALIAGILGGCAPEFHHVYPGNYAPVFSPSAAGGECESTPYTHECTTRPDVVDPNQ